MKTYTKNFPPNYDLDKYVLRMMEEKKITLARISRNSIRAGDFVSQPALSDIVKRKRGAGRTACKAIASGLGVPLNDVLLHAGIMEADPGRDEIEEEIAYIYHNLKHEWAKKQALSFMRWIASTESELNEGYMEGNISPIKQT
jgi:hypothetical protein